MRLLLQRNTAYMPQHYWTEKIPSGSSTKVVYPGLRYNMLKARTSDNRLLAASYGRGLFFTTLRSSSEAQLTASISIESLVLNENEGEVLIQQPVESLSDYLEFLFASIVLLKDEEVIFSLVLREGEEAQQNIVLSKEVNVPKGEIEFDLLGAFIDDPFREDRQELTIDLQLDMGDAVITTGSMELIIIDDESDFINLTAEQEMVSLGRTLFRDVYTFSKQKKQLREFSLRMGSLMCLGVLLWILTDRGQTLFILSGFLDRVM